MLSGLCLMLGLLVSWFFCFLNCLSYSESHGFGLRPSYSFVYSNKRVTRKMPPRIAHPAGALVTHARFGRCGTHSQKTFAQTVLAENSRTGHSLLGELKRGRRSKTKKLKTKPNFRANLSANAFDLWTPLESPRSEQWMRGCPRGLSEGIVF